MFFITEQYPRFSENALSGKEVDSLAAFLGSKQGFRTEIIRNPGRTAIIQKIAQVKHEAGSPLLVYFYGKGIALPGTAELFYLPSDALPADDYQESYWNVQTLLKALDAGTTKQIAVFFDLECGTWIPNTERYDRKIVDLKTGRVNAATTDPAQTARLYFAAPARTDRPWGDFWIKTLKNHGRLRPAFGLAEALAGSGIDDAAVHLAPFGKHQAPADVIMPVGEPSQFTWMPWDSMATRWFLPKVAGTTEWYTNGVFIDSRDGARYRYIEMDSFCWMADDLRFQGLKGSRFYEDASGRIDSLHVLYSYEAAQYACPSGWRLPNRTDMKKDFDARMKIAENIKRHTLCYSTFFEDKSSYFSGWYDSVKKSMQMENGLAMYWLQVDQLHLNERADFLRADKSGARVEHFINYNRWVSDLLPCRCVRPLLRGNTTQAKASSQLMQPAEKYGYLIDPRDGSIYEVLRWKQKLWTAQSLRFSEKGAAGGTEDLERPWYSTKYYDQAGAMRACAGLGPGWHLPSQAEWEEIMGALGGYFDMTTEQESGSANQAFITFGSQNGDFFRFRELVPYNPDGSRSQNAKEYLHWSSDDMPDGTAWAFGASEPMQKTVKKRMSNKIKLPCRCLHD